MGDESQTASMVTSTSQTGGDSTPSVTATVPPEVEIFIGDRAYYYIGRWNKLDESLGKLESGTFNWAAFFLELNWMAYRKMYWWAAGIYGIAFVIGLLMGLIFEALRWPQHYLGLFPVLLHVFIGQYGSSLYKKHVLKQLASIPLNLPEHLRKQAIMDMGGTNVWAGLAFFIATVAINVMLFT